MTQLTLKYIKSRPGVKEMVTPPIHFHQPIFMQDSPNSLNSSTIAIIEALV